MATYPGHVDGVVEHIFITIRSSIADVDRCAPTAEIIPSQELKIDSGWICNGIFDSHNWRTGGAWWWLIEECLNQALWLARVRVNMSWKSSNGSKSGCNRWIENLKTSAVGFFLEIKNVLCTDLFHFLTESKCLLIFRQNPYIHFEESTRCKSLYEETFDRRAKGNTRDPSLRKQWNYTKRGNFACIYKK